ncbi:hypothetical protein QE405_002650 [Nocardioides zeae]|uniref:Uncharacterized protein n=1 Tax=Nocardioides zeae TaxID=1457234 RepID=A0AAJ1X1Y2_9ACTN|nr:hypothetical protein [Nocardioides zeae]
MHPVEESATCLADGYRSRRRQGSAEPLKARRKAAVEVGMMFLNVSVTVVLSCLLVADIDPRDAALWGLASGIGAALGVVALRAYVPARVRSRSAEEPDEPEDPDGGWDVGSFVLAAVMIPVVMGLGFLLHGWLLVMIVLVFASAAPGATLTGALVAVVLSITVSVCAEYAVVHPLYRRWDIALD